MMETFRSLRWADYFYLALVDPRALYRQIGQNVPDAFLVSFAVPAVSAILEILALSLFSAQTGFFYYKITYGWILFFLYLCLKGIIIAALMDMAAQFFRYRGNMRETIALVNFSLFPHAFLLPLVYIFKVLHFAPLFFYSLFSFGLSVWSAAIAVQGLSEMHKAGLGRSFFIYVFPFLLIGVSVFFMIILFVLCGVGYLTR